VKAAADGAAGAAAAIDEACTKALDMLDAVEAEGERLARQGDPAVVLTVRHVDDLRGRRRLGSLLAALLWPKAKAEP